MSFYRTMLAAVAAIAISAPVFADDTTTTTTTDSVTTEQSASDTQTTKININTASAKDLMKVKGLNASKAKAIVAYRKKHGDFKATSEIANVKGFKKMSADALQAIQDQLTVE